MTAYSLGSDPQELQRLGAALRQADAVLMPPAVVGAWARKP